MVSSLPEPLCLWTRMGTSQLIYFRQWCVGRRALRDQSILGCFNACKCLDLQFVVANPDDFRAHHPVNPNTKNALKLTIRGT